MDLEWQAYLMSVVAWKTPRLGIPPRTYSDFIFHGTSAMSRCVALLLAAAAFGANAETVEVKYRGQVNLTGFDCRSHPSSLVYRTCFDVMNQYMVVNLRGSYYHYCRIPSGMVGEWRNSSSLGRYYLSNIKGLYDCRKGGIPSQ